MASCCSIGRISKIGLTSASLILLLSCGHHTDLPSYGVVPDFVLTAQTGKDFRSQALDGNVWIADFIFTRCAGPCPRMSSQMRQLGDALKGERDVRFVSFTVDPDYDTAPILAEYAKRYHADAGRWHFLTGREGTLENLARHVFKLSDVGGAMEHSTRFVVVDRKSRIRGYYTTGEPDSLTRLIADVKALLKESS